MTAEAALAGRVESIRPVVNPLDVLCQQIIGMACGDEWGSDDAFQLLKKTAPFASLTRDDFDACQNFLSGDLAAPGAFEPEQGRSRASPRIWKARAIRRPRSPRVRWFWGNVGTITSEESVRVVVGGLDRLARGAYAGDYRREIGSCSTADQPSPSTLKQLHRPGASAGGEADLPRWTSDRQSLSADPRALATFRACPGPAFWSTAPRPCDRG